MSWNLKLILSMSNCHGLPILYCLEEAKRLLWRMSVVLFAAVWSALYVTCRKQILLIHCYCIM